MIYKSDPQAIRDAKKDVDDANLAIKKNDIQKQIDALDDEIDRYNDLIDLVNDQIDAINKAADDQIDALEKIKNKWQEVIDQQEYAKNVSLLTGEFGTDAITKILTGNDDDLLAQWKDNYINTLAGIDMESQGYIGNMTEQIASLYGVDLSPLQSQFMGVKDSVDVMTDALGQAANAVGIGNVVNNTVNPTIPEGTTAPTNTESSLESAIKNETDTAMNAFDQHTDKLTNEVIPAIQAATQEMNAFNESADMDIEKTITIHYETTGEKASGDGNIAVGKAHTVGKAHVEGTVGKAFANGTGKYKGLPKAEKNALVSEYGQTEMTVLPNGDTIITDEPTMMDLPKDTVIFNEEQTKQIMDNKVDVSGSAHADGTTTTPDSSVFKPYDPDKDDSYFSKLYKAWNKYYGNIDSNVEDIQKTLSHHLVMEHNQQMHETVNQITSNSSVVNTRNIQPSVNVGDIYITCPGVTSWEVMRQIKVGLDNEVCGLHNYVDQQSRIK